MALQARWAKGDAIIAEGSDALSRADRFAPRPEVAWSLAPAVADHWRRVLGTVPSLPSFRHAGAALRTALAAMDAGTATAPVSLILPDWPSASFFPQLRRTHALFRYPAGTACLRHPDSLASPTRSRHALLVVQVPARASDPPPTLSKCQRQAAGRCAR